MRRAAARFAPVSAAPTGYLLFAVWYFWLSAAFAGLQALGALFGGRVDGAPAGAGVRAAAALLSLGFGALYLWIAHLLAGRRRLGAYLTLALTGFGLLGAMTGKGGLLALVVPALGVLVAFGAWRELEGEVQAAELVAARRAGRDAARGAAPPA